MERLARRHNENLIKLRAPRKILKIPKNPNEVAMTMKTLFLNPPSYENFDGGAGSRYQAQREIRSFWYPTWLCYPAGMIPNGKVIDAPVEGYTIDQTLVMAKDFDMVILYTSTP